MRSVITLLSVFAIALATMFAHAGSAMAMEGMTDTVMMADMNMGGDGAPACPPEICAKMKDCVSASAAVGAVAPETSVAVFAPSAEPTHLALQVPDFHDSVSGQGLRRPPRFI